MYSGGLGAYVLGSAWSADALGAYALGFGVVEGGGNGGGGGDPVASGASPRAAPFNRALREYPAATIREYPK